MNKRNFIILVTAIALLGCGEGKVTIGDGNYKPKIVVNGILEANSSPKFIRISRNLPLDAPDFNTATLVIPDALVIITDLQSGIKDTLTFESFYSDTSFYFPKIIVNYGESYRLDVTAVIDGDTLHCSSTTTVPQQGFKINSSFGFLDSLKYRERDAKDSIKSFVVNFDRSEGAKVYVSSIVAEDADTSTFIYSPINAYSTIKRGDKIDDFPSFQYTYQWTTNLETTAGSSEISLFWFYLNFYGTYQMIMLAGDKNYSDFLDTYNQVKDIDGNFDQPIFHFEGDGIGVFGSAIRDIAYFKILR